MDLNKLASLQLEKYSIASLLKHSSVFPEVDGFLCEYDFVNGTHRVIYNVLKSLLSKGEKADKVIIAQKIKNLGINLKDNLDIFSYLNALANSQITATGGIDACKELVKLRVRREICETVDKVKEFTIQNGELSIDELIGKVDGIYNEKITSYHIQDNPIDLFDGVEELAWERAKNPQKEQGLQTSYSYFNKLFGGLRGGNIYGWVSRPSAGKTTLLNDMAYKTALLNNCKALILDTENLTEDIKFRMLSAVTQIPCWHLETGNFGKNTELVTQLQKNKENIAKSRKLVFHKQVAGRPIEEIVSIIRRWYFKEVGRGNPAIIVYDYIKLTGEKDYQKKEYELIGEKVNRLKELSVELNVPILTANQLNRSAESGTDDSSAISQSDRLLWFSSFVAIFRRKTLDEMADDGIQFGSHKMIILKSRFQGEMATGHLDMVKVKVGDKKYKYVNNYLCYNISNFFVEERGDLRDVLAVQAEHYDVTKDKEEDAHI